MFVFFLTFFLLGTFLVLIEVLYKKYIWRNSFRNILEKSNILGVGYTLKKNFKRNLVNYQKQVVEYCFNSYRQRNPEYLFNKTKKRILIVGDSIPFGYGVEEELVFPRVLEKRLNSQKIEVINTGFGPINIIQIYNYFKAFSLKLRPDLVILCIDLSNFQNSIDWVWDERIKSIKIKNPKLGHFKSETLGLFGGRFSFIGRVLDQSYLFRFKLKPFISNFFKKADNQTKKILGNSDSLVKFINDYQKNKGGSWYKRRKFILKFKNLLDENRSKFLVVIFPLTSQYELSNYPQITIPQEKIKFYCSQNKILAMDLYMIYKNLILNKKDVSKYFFDSVHLTAKGHKVAAESIYNFISKKDLFY